VFYDKFITESKNGVLVLHLKDGFGSHIAIIVTAHFMRIWRFLLRVDRKVWYLVAKNLLRYLWH